METLHEGAGELRFTDPDAVRAWMRDHKRREFVDKTLSDADAVRRFVADGDYVSFDFSSFTRGPLALIREIIRQGRRDLWYCAKFTLMESTLLAAAGAVSRIDVGFMGLGDTLNRAVEEGKIKVTEWTNGTLTLRHMAGGMGVPFLPTRALLGTDTLKYSGAKVVRDPFGGKPIALVPAVTPDVGLIHVHQADVYGNARCFGPGVSPLETAAASRKVIISTDEIIDHEDIRKDPSKTTIPYYMVDAVVYAPFGAYPGGLPGVYEMDFEHFAEYNTLERQGQLKGYLDKYVYSVGSHLEMLEKRVGLARLNDLRRRATVKEGYR
ncbi:MAG: CoA transferase subunit A [candidate division NC10 bacterium]|nr:CoA transferase subunit A [Candidatus Rokubacteria bacterium]MBI4391106.1 CoA transferase subunit A [candidate division NC10 bacterium]